MESPYYEMTHDFEEENRLFQSGYVKGYHDAVMRYPDIVLCKDCKHILPKGFCHKHSRKVTDDWFCADGERQEGR